MLIPVRYKTTFFLILLMTALFPGVSLTKNTKTDSLRIVLSEAGTDTARVRLLIALGDCFLRGPSDSLLQYYKQAGQLTSDYFSQSEELMKAKPELTRKYLNFEFRIQLETGTEYYFKSDYAKALEYYFRALQIAEKLENISHISEICGSIGILLKNQGEYTKALEYYSKALDLAYQLDDLSWIASCCSNIGNVYRKMWDYTRALDFYLKALKVFEENGEERRAAITYINIGDVYDEQNDIDKALNYYRKGLELSKKSNDKVNMSACFQNIGEVYSVWEMYDTARLYFKKSIDLNTELGYRHELDNCFTMIGITYEKESKYPKAIEYFEKSLELSQNESDKEGMAITLNNLARLHLKTGQTEIALGFAKRSMDLANQTGGKQMQKDASEMLSRIYERLGSTKKALKYFKVYSALKDSLFDSEKYKALAEMESKYKNEKNENELALLTEKNEIQKLIISKRNRFILALGLFLILIIVIGYLTLRHSRLKSKHRNIELEQRLLRSQMNPHFVFNSLIAIQSYIYKSDPLNAGDYLAKFADLIRLILENSRSEFVTLEKEIKTLELYLDLQALRFGNKFTYHISIGNEINPENTMIPPMLTQPFVENAIEHGIIQQDKPGIINIDFNLYNQNKLIFRVKDNGIGRQKAAELKRKRQEKHRSLATSITKERLDIFGRRYREKYNMNINDIMGETGLPAGTEVTFAIPFKVGDI